MSKQLPFRTDFRKLDQHTGDKSKHRQDNRLQSLRLPKHMYYSTYLDEYVMRGIKELLSWYGTHSKQIIPYV